MSQYIPSAPSIVREAIVVVVGALIAVAFVRLLPPNIQQFFTLPRSNQ